MTFDDLKNACDACVCRSMPSPFVSSSLPIGIFNHVNFPMAEAGGVEANPGVHWLELVTRHPLDFNFDDLSTCYKQAITQGDLRLLPAPFGVKTEVPRDTKLQMVIREESDGTCTFLKHFIFPQKCKANFLKTVFYGQVHRPLYMRQQPTVGRREDAPGPDDRGEAARAGRGGAPGLEGAQTADHWARKYVRGGSAQRLDWLVSLFRGSFPNGFYCTWETPDTRPSRKRPRPAKDSKSKMLRAGVWLQQNDP